MKAPSPKHWTTSELPFGPPGNSFLKDLSSYHVEEPFTAIQARDDSSKWYQRMSDKKLDCGYILKVETPGFLMDSIVECERNGGVKNSSGNKEPLPSGEGDG